MFLKFRGSNALGLMVESKVSTYTRIHQYKPLSAPIKQFLDFANWSEIGDPVIRSMSPSSPSSPITKGSKIVANFAGHKLDLLVTVFVPLSSALLAGLTSYLSGKFTADILLAHQYVECLYRESHI